MTALYIRLSLEDITTNLKKGESVSIQNQRTYLNSFIKNNLKVQCGEVKEFVDDGYSGTNFERPAIKELLKEIGKGDIGCIIVKDISRFGRNYLEVGNLLEKVFPVLQVRFISIDDHFDSSENGGDVPGLEVVFKNIIHDYYSKELSSKVIQAKRNLSNKGLFLGGIPPYGYLRDPMNKHRLLIEPESAAVVRRIFKDTLAGMGYSEIARIMNQEGVESPARRLWRIGIRKGNLDVKECQKLLWRKEAIKAILCNETVIGKITNHKVERKVFGQQSQRRVCPDQQIVVEKRHEAIIEEVMFQQVQEIITIRKKGTVKHQSSGKEYVFRSLVKCGCCGRKLVIEGKQEKKYICRYARVDCNENHKNIGILEQKLYHIVFEILVGYRMLFVDESQQQVRSNGLNKVIPINTSLSGCQSIELADLFKKYVSGSIDRKQFLEMKKPIDQRQDKTDINEENRNEKPFQLTNKLLTELVREIRIKSDKNINIHWNVNVSALSLSIH